MSSLTWRNTTTWDFWEAVEYLADRAGIRLPEQEVSAEEKRARNERPELLEVNRLAGTYYYYQPAFLLPERAGWII